MKLICVLTVVLALAACGVKPKELSPPAGSTESYPRTYPAPETVDG